MSFMRHAPSRRGGLWGIALRGSAVYAASAVGKRPEMRHQEGPSAGWGQRSAKEPRHRNPLSLQQQGDEHRTCTGGSPLIIRGLELPLGCPDRWKRGKTAVWMPVGLPLVVPDWRGDMYACPSASMVLRFGRNQHVLRLLELVEQVEHSVACRSSMTGETFSTACKESSDHIPTLRASLRSAHLGGRQRNSETQSRQDCK